MPDSRAIWAMVSALRSPGDQPVRIFKVTGAGLTAWTTAARICPTSRSSRSRAEPAATRQTFLAGQPMLMSTIWAPSPMFIRAASAMAAGSVPTICTAIGPASPAKSRRRIDLTEPRRLVSEETISDTASAAPKRRHRTR